MKKIKYIRNYYHSPLQGWVRFRSSYEEAYAKYLDKKGILWIYETLLFPLGGEFYLPDFYLIKENKVIEIKGRMTKKAQRKIDKFKKLYNLKFEILYKDDLKSLGCKL